MVQVRRAAPERPRIRRVGIVCIYRDLGALRAMRPAATVENGSAIVFLYSGAVSAERALLSAHGAQVMDAVRPRSTVTCTVRPSRPMRAIAGP